MSEPKIARRAPYAVEVEEGKKYFWCACGRSAKQPFCDGSHKDTEFTPVQYVAEKSARVFSAAANILTMRRCVMEPIAS